MKKTLFKIKYSCVLAIACCLLIRFGLLAQFAGPAGQANSTAVEKDSSIFVGWANDCSVVRGYKNISNPFQGLATTGTEADAVGPADGISVVSLGDSGVAIMTFAHPIFNGPGPDFAVFENAFNDSFLELGHVEVSDNGIEYFRFPSTSNTETIAQIGPFDQFGSAEKLNNLAGKYKGGYGTPFDLEELTGITGLDVNSITHVKIIDVVGSIDAAYGSQDQFGNLINDPFPTAFSSGGFDLDAVGVCHMQFINSIYDIPTSSIRLFPNPVKDQLNFESFENNLISVEILDNQGKSILHSLNKQIDLSNFSPGNYLVRITLNSAQTVIKRIVKL